MDIKRREQTNSNKRFSDSPRLIIGDRANTAGKPPAMALSDQNATPAEVDWASHPWGGVIPVF